MSFVERTNFILNFNNYSFSFDLKPTDITTAENNYDEENQNEDNSEEQTRQLEKSSFLQMTNIFGQSFGSTAFRVRKDEKEVSTNQNEINSVCSTVLVQFFKIILFFFNFFSVVYCCTRYKARSSMLRAWRNTTGRY